MRRFWTLGPWETFLLVVLALVYAANAWLSPEFLTLRNQVNLFQLSIEKIIVALVMTFVIINAEIDLSVGSMMGLSACAFAAMVGQAGMPAPLACALCLLIGLAGGFVNGVFVARVGLPSLVVTLSTYIGYRGVARVLLEDRSIGNFPDWFNALGQRGLVGPLTLGLLSFILLFMVLYVVLERAGFGRKTYVIGVSRDVADYAGIDTARHKILIFMASGLVAAYAGLLFAARVGAVRGDVGQGFELDIITMVLLGGVSIFGGSGTLTGVGLAILIVLSLRNGMALLNVTGHIQTGVVGLLLLASVLVPRLGARLSGRTVA
ncbi:putative L-rhamnose ABC transporter, transmembrane component 1 [Rubellimicrobium mesophilum DSM 19309]|uniref:Autoinducer 2 import system permease protein LsrD n=1 Tax=Rubellimicrobium mesophilum DSM 19309 TaxID=442562 RepID=A0A017HUD2_9RHOB|nr:ABC transporter permease [Rubellimicrobium mesophilum]EYD77369.1 putative L-rhamnose ABC transporter, transmembrane component 1 [Rubellimicrobium mesophilum DSM 19309]